MKIWSLTLLRIFKNHWYLLLAVGTFVIGISLVALVPNVELIAAVFASEHNALIEKMSVLISLYGSLISANTLLGTSLVFVVVFLTALNVTALTYYIRRAQKLTKGFKRTQAGSILALISGAFGIGCAACGSVILTGLATSLGVTGLLALLPLHGAEFSIIAIGLLLISIQYLLQKIHDPLTCRTDS